MGLLIFSPEGLFVLPFRVCGEGITKGNLVSLGSLGGLEPIRKGSKFFATFFQKKLRNVFCFCQCTS